MSFTSPAPPRVHELLGEVKTLLAVTSMNDLLGGSGRIFVHPKGELGWPGTDTQGRIVLMRSGSEEGPPENWPKVTPFRFNVRADLYTTEDLDVEAYLEKVQAEAFQLIEGQKPGFDDGVLTHPFRRVRSPSPVFWERPQHMYFQSATYRTWVQPK